jgi:hypothetical protein
VPDLPLPPPAHAAPLPAARAADDGVSVLGGVPYAALPGTRPLELDLYLPAARPAPVVVFVHGGGWRLGSRHSAGPAYARTSAFEAVARAGIAVASVDHRLSAEAAWPAQLHDVKAAVRWLRARAGELGVDPGRVSAWGESAGGHLAALLGLTAGDPGLEGDSWFSWIGGHAPGDVFYYRVQSPVVVVELDHHCGVFLDYDTPKPFHVHTVLRTPHGNDYGRSWVRQWQQRADTHG